MSSDRIAPDCGNVRRYYRYKTTRVYAVKRLARRFKVAQAHLFENEIAALRVANDTGVPRVATYVEQGYCLCGDRCLVFK